MNPKNVNQDDHIAGSRSVTSADSPRLLVLRGQFPGAQHGGGVVMQELLAPYPQGNYVCFAVDAHGHGAASTSDAGDARKQGRIVPRPPRRGARWAMPLYRALGFRLGAAWRVRQAVDFGRRHRVDLVWAELQGDPLFIARDVARGLGVPLVGTVWDDPEGWMQDKGYDRWSRRMVEREFAEALRSARCVSTAGEAMQAVYRDRYGVDSVILRHGFTRPAEASVANGGDCTIGFVGSPYGKDTWRAFLEPIASLNADPSRRRIRLQVFGAPGFPHSHPGVPIDIRGWAPADVMLQDLSKTDFCYLPYWFEAGKRAHVELSFPNKFETYIAATRPVFYHGPDYAGITRTVRDYDVGVCVHSLDPDLIAAAIARLMDDTNRRRAFEQSALSAFHREFNASVMHRNFAALIGVDASGFGARGPVAA